VAEPLLEMLSMSAQDYRERQASGAAPWYLVLPAYLPYHGGRTWERFCAEFDESARRTLLASTGCVGFEIYPAAGQIRRHRIGWLDQPTPPEEDTDAVPA
jgi:hypothetical protein